MIHTMRSRFLLWAAALLLAVSCGTVNKAYLVQGGQQALQAAMITDDQIRSYVHQYISQTDASSRMAPADNDYTRRLKTITAGLNDIDGVPLNFEVYITDDVNAFACADGSVRVYSGLLDLMNDNEVLGVIGHEIGHVALKHTKKQMQVTLLTSAVISGASAFSDKVATLSQSQLGAIGQTILNAQYSQKQETEADDYAYDFLKKSGKNPACLMQGFQKLQQLEGGSAASSWVTKLFSDHPDTGSRIARIQGKLTADGITY